MERRHGEKRAKHLITGLALTALGAIGLYANMDAAGHYQIKETQGINMTRVLPPKPTEYDYNQAVIRIGAYEDARDHAAKRPDSLAVEWINRPSTIEEQKKHQQIRANYQINEVIADLKDSAHSGKLRSRLYGILIAWGTSIGASLEGNAFVRAMEKRRERLKEEMFFEEQRKRQAA